jgi:hypothetical protein
MNDAEENVFPPSVRAAYQALLALTVEQRGLVLCWFCDVCHVYVGPGDCHSCKRGDENMTDVKQCRAYWIPGVLRPPGQPRFAGRCQLLSGHEGDHIYPEENES